MSVSHSAGDGGQLLRTAWPFKGGFGRIPSVPVCKLEPISLASQVEELAAFVQRSGLPDDIHSALKDGLQLAWSILGSVHRKDGRPFMVHPWEMCERYLTLVDSFESFPEMAERDPAKLRGVVDMAVAILNHDSVEECPTGRASAQRTIRAALSQRPLARSLIEGLTEPEEVFVPATAVAPEGSDAMRWARRLGYLEQLVGAAKVQPAIADIKALDLESNLSDLRRLYRSPTSIGHFARRLVWTAMVFTTLIDPATRDAGIQPEYLSDEVFRNITTRVTDHRRTLERISPDAWRDSFEYHLLVLEERGAPAEQLFQVRAFLGL